MENTGNGIPREACNFTARLPGCPLHHYSLLLKTLLKALKNFLNPRLNTCTVEEPSDPWHPTFTLGQIENIGYFIPTDHIGHSTCNLLFTGSKHWDPFNFLRAQSCYDLNLHLNFYLLFKLCQKIIQAHLRTAK